MFVYRPDRPNGLVVVTDTRTRADAELDFHQGLERGQPRVLSTWAAARALPGGWWNTTRVALFEHSAEPTRKQLQAQRNVYLDFLTTLKDAVVFVVPTAPAGSGEAAATVTTEVWRPFEAPDALAEMRGAFLRASCGQVVAGYPLNRRAKQLHVWQQEEMLERALDVASGRVANVTDSCPYACITPSATMVDMLLAMRDRPVAVDLEFIPDTNTIMAIGVACEEVGAVSIPYHGFDPGSGQPHEPGLAAQCESQELLDAILSALTNILRSPHPKAAHNFVADFPRLEKVGFEVNGPMLDTFAAHAIAYPELRHGLQQACASMFTCRPWKSLWKPKAAKGLTRDDLEYWTCEPEGLRRYNAADAWHTAILARKIAPSVKFDWRPSWARKETHD